MNVGTLTIEMAANVVRLQRDMDQARRSVDNAMSQIKKSAGLAMNALGALGVGLSIAGVTAFIKKAIDAADEMVKLSAKTGVAVKDIAGLQLAFQLSGLEGGALASSMAKLSKAIFEGDEALRRMGVAAKDNKGQLRDTKDVLYDLADSFAGMKDGPAKAAMAMQLFGKSGADMIPLLNGGSAGLREMAEQAERLGLVIDEKTAAKAEQFNDTLDMMGMGLQGVARGAMAQLMPTLTNLASSFLTSMTEGDKLANTANALAFVFKALYTVAVGVSEVFSTVGKTLGAAVAQTVAFMTGDFKGAQEIGKAWQADMVKDWSSTTDSIAKAWSSTADESVLAQATMMKSGTKLGASDKELAATAKQATDAHKKMYDEVLKAAKAAADARNKEYDDIEEYMKEQERERIATVKAAGEAVKAAQLEYDQHGMTRSQIAELTKQRLADKLTGVEAGSAIAISIQAQIDKQQELIRILRDGEVRDSMEDAAEANRDAWLKMNEQIGQSLTDAIMSGGKSAGEMLKNYFKTLILRPLIQAIGSPIANMASNVLYGANGAGGGVAGSAASGAQGMLSSVASGASLYSAYSSSTLGQFMSGFSGSAGAAAEAMGGTMTTAAQTGSNVAGGLSGAGGAVPYLGIAGGGLAAYGVAERVGGFGGAVAGTAAGAGTIAVGGAITGAAAGTGMAAGAMTALAAIPVWGWLAIGALAVLGSMQKGPEKHTRLTFGSNNEAGNISINERGNEGKSDPYISGHGTGAFGTFGVTSSFWMDTAQPAVQGFIQSVTATDDALASFMSTTEKAAVTAALTGHTMVSRSGAEGTDPNGLGGMDAVFRDRIEMVMKTVQPGMEALIADFKGDAKALAMEATMLMQYRTALRDTGESVFGVVVTMEQLAALRKTGESAAQAIGRLIQEFDVTNAIAGLLGKTAVEAFGAAGLASEAAREQFLKLSGGLDVIANNAKVFAENYLTEAERMAPLARDVQAAMAGLGLSSVTTREQFKQTVLSLDLTSEAGVKQYHAMMALAGAFAQVHPQIAATVAALNGSTGLASDADIAKSLADVRKSLLDGAKSAFDALGRAVEAERKRVTAGHQSVMAILNDQIKDVTDSVGKLRNISGALRNALDAMRMKGAGAIDREGAQASLFAALRNARIGGTTDSDALTKTLAALGGDSSSMFGDEMSYKRDYYSTAIAIADFAEATDAQLTIEERMLAVLEEQRDAELERYEAEMERLDSIMENAQAQLDALNGINNGVLSISEALASFGAAMGAAQMGGAGSSAPVAQTNMSATERVVQSLYGNILGRVGEKAGVEFWTKALNGGASMSEVTAGFLNSDEYRTKLAQQKMPGFANGGNHEGGWRMVGERGPEVAYTGPQTIANASDTRKMIDQRGTEKAIEKLTETVEMWLFQVAKNTGSTDKKLGRVIVDDRLVTTAE